MVENSKNNNKQKNPQNKQEKPITATKIKSGTVTLTSLSICLDALMKEGLQEDMCNRRWYFAI